MFKKIYLFLFLILASCGGGSSYNTPNVICSVEINADSICSATGISETCAQMITDVHPTWVITDRAVGGLALFSLVDGYSTACADCGLAKFGTQLPFSQIIHTSKIVSIELGGDDAFDYAYNGNGNATLYESELRGVISNIQAQGKIALLTGILPFEASSSTYYPGDPFDQATVNLAAQFNIIQHKVATDTGSLDAHWDSVPFNPLTDTIDGIHRTAPAMRLLVNQLINTISPICK